MPGTLFTLPCPDCGSVMHMVVRDTVECLRCQRSYLVKFGHLIEITRGDDHTGHDRRGVPQRYERRLSA